MKRLDRERFVEDLSYSRHVQSARILELTRAQMHLDEHAHTLRSWLGAGHEARVCDVGCGTGSVLRSLVKGSSLHATGVDADSRFVRVAQALARRTDYWKRLVFIRARGEDLPFEAGSFDCAFAIGVLQVVTDPARVIDEMFRIVRPGGIVLAACVSGETVAPNRVVEELEGRVAALEQEMVEALRLEIPTARSDRQPLTAEVVLNLMRERSGNRPRVRGLWMPCCAGALEQPEYERYVSACVSERVKWATRLSRSAGDKQEGRVGVGPLEVELFRLYGELRRALLAVHRNSHIAAAWDAPPLLVVIAGVPAGAAEASRGPANG